MKLRELFLGMPLETVSAELPEHDLPDITLDSRRVVPGGLFVAVPGTRVHGLRFVPEAAARGACAVAWDPAGIAEPPPLPAGVAGLRVPGLRERLGEVADRFFAAPSAAMAVTGITGTNGKTTTAWLLVQASEWLGARTGYVGTLGTGIGTELVPATLTTPDCISVHRQLRALADGGAQRVAMEVSSHALDQDRVAGVHFAAVAFTNLSRDHLDYHGDLERYGAAKARLFRHPDTIAVIHTGDAFGRRLARERPPGQPLIRVALAESGAEADIVGRVTELTPAGLVLELESAQYGRAVLKSPLWGRFNAENLLVTAGLLVAHGHSLPQAAAALAGCGAPPGRLQRLAAGGSTGPAVLVDFAHTPDALEKVLGAVREHCTGRLTLVFGCGGDRDPGKRAPMGAVAARLADRVVVTDDNPREEDAAIIRREILAGMPEGIRIAGAVSEVPDRGRAIREAIRAAGPGDVVLIAGKGHERFQIIGRESLPFSDADAAAAALDTRAPRRATTESGQEGRQ